jgi:hypothetical protein
VNRDDLRPIWSTSDFRDVVIALRALGAPDLGVIAPVIDIRTRQRIA